MRDKTLWLEKNMESDKSKSHRLLVFACGEGIFFTSSFLFIFYFRSLGILQNITFANEQISKDEAMHRDAGILRHIREGLLTMEDAHKIIEEAIKLEFSYETNYRLLGSGQTSALGYTPLPMADKSR